MKKDTNLTKAEILAMLADLNDNDEVSFIAMREDRDGWMEPTHIRGICKLEKKGENDWW